MDIGQFIKRTITFCTFICGDREKMNRDITILKIKPIMGWYVIRNIGAQHEIELWYKKEPAVNRTSVMMGD